MTRKTVYIITYRSGRILSYALLGFLYGSIGKGLFIVGFHQNVSVILGVMVILGVLFFNESKIQNRLNSNSKWYLKFKSYFGAFIQKKTFSSFLIDRKSVV